MPNPDKLINFVVSYPKSGATWFRFLMYACEYGKINPTAPIGSYYPEIHNRPDLIEKKLKEGKTFFVKSHHIFSEKIDFLDRVNCVIYLIRNPFDAMLSRLSHYILEGNTWLNEEKNRMKLIRDFIASANESKIPNRVDGGWNVHVLSWLVENHKIPVIVLRYEDLLQNTSKELRSLNSNLELGFSEQQINNAASVCSFEKMKQVEEHELLNEVPGMFYSPERKKTFQEKGVQFINQGKSGVGLKDLPCDILQLGFNSFKEGLILGKYLAQLKENACIDSEIFSLDNQSIWDRLSNKIEFNN